MHLIFVNIASLKYSTIYLALWSKLDYSCSVDRENDDLQSYVIANHDIFVISYNVEYKFYTIFIAIKWEIKRLNL